MTRPVAVALLLVTTMLWGFAFVAQKSAMDSMGPLTFAAARYLLGGLAILPLALLEYRRKPAPLDRRGWGLTLFVGVVFFFGSWLQQTGLTVTTVTNGGFLTGLYVLFVPLIAFLAIRQKPHPIIYAGVPLALAGLFLLNGASLDNFNTGDYLIICSAVFWGMHVSILGYVARLTGLPIFVSALSFLLAGTVALAGALLFEDPSFAAIGQGWVQLLYAGLLSTAVAFTLQAVGQQYVPPANAAVILSSESLFAALGGFLLLGERLPAIGYVGAAMMFAAIVLVEAVPAWSNRKQLPIMEAH